MPERRATPRATIALACTLRRERGTPIDARTIDLGAAGMCVRSGRPLAVDEVVAFDLPLPPVGARHVDGQARVLRQERHDTYALRFENLGDGAARELRALAAAVPAPPVR